MLTMPKVDVYPSVPLTAKEERFLLEYPACNFNAKEAAIRAGYPAKTAKQQGCRVLKKIRPLLEEREQARRAALVQQEMQRVTALGQEVAARAESDPPSGLRIARAIAGLEESLQMVTSLAFYDPRKLFEGNNLKNIDSLSEQEAVMIEDFQLEENFTKVGDKAEHTGYTKKVRLANRAPYLNMLLRWHGAFAEKAPPKPAELPPDLSNWTAEDLETYKKLKAKLVTKVVDVK